MKRTENLSLPIYDNPESDIFKINDVNNAHETIDKQYKELKNIKETVESTNPSANLQGQINDISASLEHKTYYCKTLIDMKKNNYKVGDMVITLGYYSENDGGGATYLITNFDDVADDCSIVDLDNGLKAYFKFDYDRISLKQIGGKSEKSFDNKIYIDKYIAMCERDNKTYELFIPYGKWYFSPTLIYRKNGVNIKGVGVFPGGDTQDGSILAPINDIQDYIWKLGGDADVTDMSTTTTAKLMTKSKIEGVIFTTKQDGYNSTTKYGMFYIDLVTYSSFDKIYCYSYRGVGVAIRSSWELYFGVLNFRIQKNNADEFGRPNLLFANARGITGVSANISGCEFQSLMFENISGDCVFGEPVCGFNHNSIINVNVELTMNTENVEATEEIFTNTTDISNSIVLGIVKGYINYSQIGNINVVHNSASKIVIGNKSYYFGGVIVDNSDINLPIAQRLMNVSINSISLRTANVYNRLAVIYARKSRGVNQINISNLVLPGDGPLSITDVESGNNIRIGTITSQSRSALANNVSNMNDAYLYCNKGTNYGVLCTDLEATNPLKLVFKKAEGDGTLGLMFNYPYIVGETHKIRLMLKAESGVSGSFGLYYKENGTTKSKTINFVGTGKYEMIESAEFSADYGSLCEFRTSRSDFSIDKFAII